MAELCREFRTLRKIGYKIFDRYQVCGVRKALELQCHASAAGDPLLSPVLGLGTEISTTAQNSDNGRGEGRCLQGRTCLCSALSKPLEKGVTGHRNA